MKSDNRVAFDATRLFSNVYGLASQLLIGLSTRFWLSQTGVEEVRELIGIHIVPALRLPHIFFEVQSLPSSSSADRRVVVG